MLALCRLMMLSCLLGPPLLGITYAYFRRKVYWLYFKRFLAGMWPCRVCFLSHLVGLSTLAHTFLLISGSAIPENKYKFSMLVGLRNPSI